MSASMNGMLRVQDFSRDALPQVLRIRRIPVMCLDRCSARAAAAIDDVDTAVVSASFLRLLHKLQ
jgi:hypothetical protein